MVEAMENFEVEFESVKVKLEQMLRCVAAEKKETLNYSPEEKEIYQEGITAGFQQAHEFTSGKTYEDERQSEIYDRGANVGQLFGRLKEAIQDFDEGKDSALVFLG